MDKVLNMQSTKDFILDKIAYWALSHKTDQKDGFLADADIAFPEKKAYTKKAFPITKYFLVSILILLGSYAISGIIYFSTRDDYLFLGKEMNEWLALYILAPLIPAVLYFIFAKIKLQKESLSKEKVVKKKKKMHFWKKCGLSLIALFIPSAIQTALKMNGVLLNAVQTVILFAPFTIFFFKVWKNKKAEEDQPAENDK